MFFGPHVAKIENSHKNITCASSWGSDGPFGISMSSAKPRAADMNTSKQTSRIAYYCPGLASSWTGRKIPSATVIHSHRGESGVGLSHRETPVSHIVIDVIPSFSHNSMTANSWPVCENKCQHYQPPCLRSWRY